MTFNRPTPNDILQRIQAEIDILLPGADARLRQSVEGVFARVVAMASHEMYGYLSWIARQILPDTADAEMLQRHANLWRITRTAATKAAGAIQFTGVNGTIIPQGSTLKRADDVEYILDADVTIAGTTGNGTVTAALAQSAGNAGSGTKLTLTSPITGVQSDGLVQAGGLTGGTDTESDDALRIRVIERIQRPPHGGSAFDYESWGKEVSGVTRVWIYPEQLGDGTVVVIFVMDNKVGTIIPSVGEVATVQDYIDTKKPVTADVTVIAPTAVPVDFTINIGPNTLAIQNAIKAEIEDLFKRESEPGGTLYISRIREAISSAAGEFDNVLVAPSANVTRTFGEISTLGNITWGGI